MFSSNILHPNRYHGFNAQPPFFEGWYFKLVSADEQVRFAVIPGVYLAKDHQKSHSFVQVFDSEANEVRFHQYPIEAFKPSRESFEISVGPNYFSADRINLAIDDALGSLSGELAFENLTGWPVQFFSPGAMGWFAWVPFMECYHGVVSMDHRIQGQLILDGEDLNFTDGRGYIEKDWGKHFPSAWIWGQSNHFDQEGVSLMLSVAVIPWLGQSFAGFIIGFLLDGTLHRFATYNRSKVNDIALSDTSVHLVVSNPSHQLTIDARRSEGGMLQAPTEISMDRRIIETINAKIDVRLEDHKGRLIFEGSGHHAGLETVGELNKLIKMIKG